MAYNFDKKIVVGNWETQVDTQAMYGCFENEKTGRGGGLWFEKLDGSEELHLRDYDGVFEMPVDVIAGLRKLDLNVGEEYEPDDEPPTSEIVGFGEIA